MRLHVLSDLHLEFAPFELPEVKADVLVLAGDIHVGIRGVEQARRWSDARGLPVVYVAGNHEYYRQAIPRHTDKLRAAAGDGVYVLDRDNVVIGTTRFLGATLWAGFDLFGDEQWLASMRAAQDGMSDFRLIRVSPSFHRFHPANMRGLHVTDVSWLEEQLALPHRGGTVVVTHHAPSLRSVAPQFREDLVTAAYASPLERLLAPPVDLWVHGHTHFRSHYTVGSTRVACNPRGYPGELVDGFDPALVLEV